jgi:putative transposase
VKRSYHTIDRQGKVGERKLAKFLVRQGQALLPMLELIEQSQLAIDELIDVMGRASLEAVLELSAQQVAGPPQQGRARATDIVWHGTQPGRVFLKERQLRVNKPRLRRKGRGANKEVPVPAYEAMQREVTTGERMLQILLNGVSTRRYQRVIPEMADTVGVSKSTVSREAIEASEAALKQLMERRFEDLDLLILYIDGMRFGDQCVLAAVGVDVQGRKHVLALREGATENAEAAKDLLQHLVEHGVDPRRRRLFVIDGSKALRTAINAVFGAETPVQRCRNHKLRNVLGRLPREQQTQTASLMRAAWKMNPEEGMAKFRQIARLAGGRLSGCRRGVAGRLGGMLYHQPAGCSALAASLFGRPAISWIIRTPEFASAPGACVAGKRVWRRAGRPPRSWKSKSHFAR